MIFILPKRHQTIVSNNRKHRRRRRRLSRKGRYVILVGIIALVLFFVFFAISVKQKETEKEIPTAQKKYPDIQFDVRFLDPNPYSRPQLALKKVNAIVVHYTANPGVDAVANRNYFNNLPKTNEKKENKPYASSHFIIGLEGNIIQCIPLEEMSYASNNRNSDTVSIECCHPHKDGKFTGETYESLLRLCTYLCIKFDLSENDLIRHYDVTGKNCPKYFVENPDKWEKLKKEVGKELQKYQ